MSQETTILMSSSRLKFGSGATREVGYDMRQLGARRVMVVTDPNLARSEAVAIVLAALRAEGLDAVLYDRVRIEPTDVSFKEAIQFATTLHTPKQAPESLMMLAMGGKHNSTTVKVQKGLWER